METENYTNDTDTINPISRIDFDILGNPEIERISVFGTNTGCGNANDCSTKGIDIVELYDNSEPKRGGLIDPRLGTTSNEIICATCGLSTTFCPGHPGHITLEEYVFHPGYLQTVIKILSCICLSCSKILIHKNEAELKEISKTKAPKERLAFVRNATKNINACQKDNIGCGTPHPKLKYDDRNRKKGNTKYENKKKTGVSISVEYENDAENEDNGVKEYVKKQIKRELTAEEVFGILKNISDDDCIVLGLDPKRTRPEYMILKIFLVPPVQMRPSVRGDFAGGMVTADDLTLGLADIIKSNLRIIKIKENNNENSTKFHSDYAYLLQYHVATYMENGALGMAKSERKGKVLRSVASRIKGKSGRIRGNLMGKRGDYTGRTVITSDSGVRHNQMRIPVAMAKNLTFPEVVTPNNIEFLTTLVARGKDNYPGANSVIPLSRYSIDNRILPIDLRFRKGNTILHYGDIVHRHLIDDDLVLLNRQPTLHKQSMMAFYIKVINDENLMTFGLSPSVTKPFNADFDGDLKYFLSSTASCL